MFLGLVGAQLALSILQSYVCVKSGQLIELKCCLLIRNPHINLSLKQMADASKLCLPGSGRQLDIPHDINILPATVLAHAS